MEAIDILADGPKGVRAVGGKEYFAFFYDWMDLDGNPHFNPTITEDEMAALKGLLEIVNTAYDAIDDPADDDLVIASGWPDRIAFPASHALSVFNARGLFDEEHEEPEPSGTSLR